MVNKKNIWFMTLFSLIIVLSVYYITMPNELLVKTNNKTENDKKVSEQIEDSNLLVALRVEKEEEYLTEVQSLTTILTNDKSTIEEKNNAYEQIKNINVIKGEEEQLEKQIEELTKSKVFVKINKDQIKIVIDKKEHDTKLANQIMRLAQSNYKNKMYITVKFQPSN